MPTDDERYFRHLRDTGQEDDPALRRAWEEEDARNRQAQEAPGGRGWQDQFRRARYEWERDTRRTGEWDRWDADEREQQFAQHAQRLGYGSQEDLQDYLAGKSPGQEKGTYDDLMGRIADARAAREGGLYQVKPGDSLSQIAQRFGLDVEDLLKWNPRPDRNLLRVGEVITLPAYRAAKTPPPQPRSIPQGGLLGRPPEGAPTGHWQDEAIPMPPMGSAEWLRWAAGPKTRRVWKEDEPSPALAQGNLDWLRRRLMPEAPTPTPVSPRFGEELSPIGAPGASEDNTARQLERMFTGEIAETPETGLLEGLAAAGEVSYLPSQALAYLGSRLTGGPEEWSPESTEWINILRRLGVPEGRIPEPMTPEERRMANIYSGEASTEVPLGETPSLLEMLAAGLQYGPGDPLNYPLAAFTAPGRLLARGAAGLAERAAARGGRAAVEAAEALSPGARRLAAGEVGALKLPKGKPFFEGMRPEDIWDGLGRAEKARAVKAAGLQTDVAAKPWAKVTPEERTALSQLVPEQALPEAKPLPGQALMPEAGVTKPPVYIPPTGIEAVVTPQRPLSGGGWALYDRRLNQTFGTRRATFEEAAAAADKENLRLHEANQIRLRSIAEQEAAKPSISPQQQRKLPTKPQDYVTQLRAELRRLNAQEFKSINDEIMIARLKAQIDAKPERWKVGQGVGWKATRGQVNRGYRIEQVIPETKEAIIRPVGDIGQLADYTGQAERVSIIDLIRDKKYDAPKLVPPEAPRGRLVAEGGRIPKAEVAAKEPWQMTKAEWMATGVKRALPPELEHRGQVWAALAEGKPVPPEVLAEYPDLARAAPTPPVEAMPEAVKPLVGLDSVAEPKINRYANLLPNATERRYASAYVSWLKGHAIGPEPERGRLSLARANAIQRDINALHPWGEPFSPPVAVPETEAIDLTGRAILEPPPSQITPELAEEIRQARLAEIPSPAEAIPDTYATSWNNMPVEKRATILKALGRDEGLARSPWETIAQTEREAIIEGVARRSEDAWRRLDDAVELLERQAAEAGTTLTEIPAPLAGAGGGKGGRHKGPPPRRPRGVGAPTGGTQGGLPGAAADLLFGYPGESNRTAIGRQFGGQRTAAFLRITAEGQEGQNILAQAMEETGQKVIKRAGDRNFEGVVFDNDDLMRALHGEGPVPVGYERFHDWARAAVKAEEDRMVLVDPDFARYIEANPDYFYRAWQLPKGDESWPVAWRRLGFGDEPGFLKERVKPSYTQMREWGFEPLSRNPVDMIVLRRIAGEERRLLLVTRQKLEAARLIMPASQAPEGWRVPRNIGTLFTGMAEQPAMAVPNQVANVLERVFHVRPSGKGWTFVKAVVDFQDTVKQYKFMGSLFQHLDFLFRTGYVASTLTGIRNLAPLKYIPLGTRLMAVRALKSSQRALKREIMSGEPLYEDFPITGAMLVEEGLSIRGDPTMLARPMLESYQKVLAQGGVPPGWKQLAKARGNSVKNFTVDWLFEGVYPESQWWSLKNFIIPRLRADYPKWTPRQIAGLAATEANKMFSTIAPFQSWFKSPEAFDVSRLFLFSGELEAWTRQAGSIFKGPAKRLWGEYHLGMFVFLAAVANVLNFWAEGKFIPPEDYSPIKVGDKFSPWPGGIAYNTRWFAPKIAGAVGEAGRPLYLDIVGQADTVLRWAADPVDGSLSRMNVFWQAARRQLEGKTFWGEKLETPLERAGALLQDVAGPIGPSNIGDVLRQQYPDLPFPLPASGEPRIGTTGSLIQATGFNVRAARNAEMLNEIAQRFYGRNWNELTLPERRKQEVAGEAEVFLPPKGGGADYLDTLYGRIANYWDRADAIYEGYRKRLQEVPIGQSFDRTKLTDARQQALNNLKKELKLSDDDLYGERPFATGRTSLTDIIMWIIRQGENVGRAAGVVPPEKTIPEPHYEAMNRALAESPPMLEAWLRGLQPGTLGPLPIGQRIPAIKGENEDFSQNEKQMFRRMSDVYWAIPDNLKDRNNIINWDLSSERQDQFLRALPEPMRERFYQYLKRNQSPGDMVRDIWQEWVADYYNVKGATPQETAALRQQWLVGHPAPNASDIAVDILHRYGYRFTEKEEEVDHPRKYHVTELSDALAGLNLPDIDEYQRRTNAQKVAKLQETGQGFYATSGVLIDKVNLPEYQKAQQWLEETEAQRNAWKASEGLRNQRDGLYAYRDRLRETYNAIHDNPDVSLDDKQAAYEQYKANRESVNNQLASIRAKIPAYPIWPDYVAKYFSAPPSGQDREQWTAMAEAGNIPDTRAIRAQSVDAAIFQIFETMPTTEKGATSEEISAWWDANTPRLKELGYRQEPFKEEIGRLFDTMPDFGEKPTKEQRAILSKWWDDNKPRLIELGWTPKWESQVLELAREWWDARRAGGETTTDIDALATHLESLGMGDKESLQTYMVGPGADDLEKAFIWSEYYGLQAAGKKDEASQYFQAKKSRLKELGWETTPEQDEIDQIFEEYGRRKAENKKDAYNWLESMKPRLAELGYRFKDEEGPGVTVSTAKQEWWDALTTEGTPEWRAEFEAVHNRPPNNIDYFRDYLWSLDFQRSKGRGPSRAEWVKHYWQDVRQGRPRSRTPEFAPSGNGNRTLTNAQWRGVQDLLGRTGTNEVIGSRFDSDRMSADARAVLQKLYRENPRGARSFQDWLLMARNAYRREDLVPAGR